MCVCLSGVVVKHQTRAKPIGILNQLFIFDFSHLSVLVFSSFFAAFSTGCPFCLSSHWQLPSVRIVRRPFCFQSGAVATSPTNFNSRRHSKLLPTSLGRGTGRGWRIKKWNKQTSKDVRCWKTAERLAVNSLVSLLWRPFSHLVLRKMWRDCKHWILLRLLLSHSY